MVNRNGGRPKGAKNKPGMLSTRFTKEHKERYCAELALHGEMALALNAVGVTGKTIRNHRDRDPEFREAEEEAMAQYRSSLAKEIHRRGVEGWDEPIYWSGILVGYKRRFSDTLLLAQAKRHSPEHYGDRLKVDQRTTVDGGLGIALESLSPESRALLRRIIETESEKG